MEEGGEEMNAVLLVRKEEEEECKLRKRLWIESKKLSRVAGLAIFSRVATYNMIAITQAFGGHLNDLELAFISIANNVIVGFTFGLLVHHLFFFKYSE